VSEARHPVLPYAALAGLALIWGASFLFIRPGQHLELDHVTLDRRPRVLAVVLGSLSYAVSALFQRRRLRGVSVYEVSLGQLAATAVLALPVAAPSLSGVHVALPSMAAVIALGVGGSEIAYLLYYYTMDTLGPVRATGVTVLVPVTAVFWGVVLLHETLTPLIVTGMVVIMTGIVLTHVQARKQSQDPEKETAAA
jgi:drug/metabolite transporter (DMT)-like permease